uniref:Syntaxin 6 n=1 Tax=Xenopus tropicalis TaxID=8364 RepID=A0A803J2D9_XENTR
MEERQTTVFSPEYPFLMHLLPLAGALLMLERRESLFRCHKECIKQHIIREVQKAVNTAQGLFQRWTDLLQDPSISTREELDWTTNELRNNLRSIEWDLEDLDETISIVESNPRKFSLDPAELRQRKAFISETRQCVKALLGEGTKHGWNLETEKYKALDQELENANSQFLDGQVGQQQLIMEQQDEQLELVSGSIGVLKNMSQRIGSELDEQAVMLDDFSHELDTAQSRMDNVLKKLAKVSHMTSDRRQWCAIIILLSLLLVVLILFFAL